VAKYTAEQLASLARALTDPLLQQQTVGAIEALMPIAKDRRVARTKGPGNPGITVELNALRSVDPDKAELLLSLHSRLKDRKVLAGARALREFAGLCGIKGRLPEKREQAISWLMHHLTGMPLAEIRDALGRPISDHRDFGEEYERWADLILGRRPAQ